jgi:UMF1 family MFS transporter
MDNPDNLASTENQLHPSAPRGANRQRDINDKREIFGWVMYDWANSAFYTTVVGALFGPYLTELAKTALGGDLSATVLNLGFLGSVTAGSLYPLTVAVAVFSQVFLLPILGAIADYSHLKKRLMMIFCYIGVVANCLMFLVKGNFYLLGSLLFIISNLGFGGSIVLYNAYLPEITTEDQRDKISSRGFAWGYMGGGLLLAVNFVLISVAPDLGISQGMAVRLSFLSAGLWWGGFSIITFKRLKTRAPAQTLLPSQTYLSIGLSQLRNTFRELRRLPFTLKFLIGYLFYNDGIQTVIGVAAVFLGYELFGKENPSFSLKIFLMVQFVAFFGSLIFERIANAIGTKRAILVSLLIWSGLVIYAYGFFHTEAQAWVMAALIAIVLGGSQALSRSLFSRMIPKGRESSFFGLYEVSERGTSWMGPLVFSIVVAHTGSYRQALLSLIFFFVVGMLILFFTDTDRAIHEAGNFLPEEAEKQKVEGGGQ